MRRFLTLSVVALAFMAASAFAGTEARLTGKVLDAATKSPIADATIKVQSTEKRNVSMDTKTKKDGTYTIFLLDGTLHYKFTYSAPGYVPYEETLKLSLGVPNMKDVMLTPAAVAAAPAGGEAKADPAVEAYNAGATLANEGKYAEAAAKFEEALVAKPGLLAARRALAKVSVRTKNWAKAIEQASKSLAVDDDDPEMYSVLFEAYTATGDKAKAAEAKAKVPVNAAELYNDAVRLLNANKDAEAEKVLRQVIAADDKFALAYFHLGMVAVRAGRNAEARAGFEKYLELEPTGSEAATAKEMLKYVK